MKRFSFRTLSWLWLAIVLAMFSPSSLFACAVCYGESDAPMARGVTWAIVSLGAIIGCVLSGVVVFFVHMKRKSASLNGDGDDHVKSV